MASTTERCGNAPYVRPNFSRAHAVIAAPIAIMPYEAKRMLRGEALADLACQDRAVD
jgi:hypothetical protein